MDNPSYFNKPFSFEITFECLAPLQQDLEWKVLYVGSAESSAHDQVLEEVQVGPVPQGVHKFVLQSEAPDVTKLPPESILGVTVVLVTCTYRDQEFCRIGYYVNHEVLLLQGDISEHDLEIPAENNDGALDVSRVVRTILADKPRVTRFPIQWDPRAAVAVEDRNNTAPYDTPLKQHHATTNVVTVEMDGPPTLVSPPSTQEDMQI